MGLCYSSQHFDPRTSRMISPCDPCIEIGLYRQSTKNMLRQQRIKIDHSSKLHKLLSAKQNGNKLVYRFDDDILLILTHNKNNIEYDLMKCNDENYGNTNNIIPSVLHLFSNINDNSHEFNQIGNLMQCANNYKRSSSMFQ